MPPNVPKILAPFTRSANRGTTQDSWFDAAFVGPCPTTLKKTVALLLLAIPLWFARGWFGGAPAKIDDLPSITSFEAGNPFTGGVLVDEHATHGKKALRLDKGYISLDTAQNWTGYDYLKV